MTEHLEHLRMVEALLFAAAEPLDEESIVQRLPGHPEVGPLLAELREIYARRGVNLVRRAGKWMFQTAPDLAPYIERFVLEGQSARLSAAALETMAIVAYKQPLSRAQVAAIRGVNVDGVMRTLQTRGYIEEVARDPGPGQAVLFGTTRLFLEKLGIDSLDDLPPLGEFVPGPEVMEALEAGLRVTPPDGIEQAPEENPADDDGEDS